MFDAHSPYAEPLKRKGANTQRALGELLSIKPQDSLFALKGAGEDPVKALADCLDGWDDAKTAQVLDAIAVAWRDGFNVAIADVCLWIRAQPDKPDAVVACIRTDAPDNISIIRLLSTAGSQKLVFLANWESSQREVVVKRFIDEKLEQQLLSREMTAHGLSIRHDNIIETHFITTKSGKPLLVEEKLPVVLDDDWRAPGVAELANLLRDIGCALEYLHREDYVHGDVKPDNIGYGYERYILLDFGICRKREVFAALSSPTGSLRTRAPELFDQDEGSHLSFASDLWALGATIYSVATGRYPFFAQGEAPPRISSPEARREFTEVLRKRVHEEFGKWVDLAKLPSQIQPVMKRILDADPEKRGTAGDLVKECESGDLAAFLRRRHDEDSTHLSVSQEVDQYIKYLAPAATIALAPLSERRRINHRLRDLAKCSGLTEEQQAKLRELVMRVPNA